MTARLRCSGAHVPSSPSSLFSSDRRLSVSLAACRPLLPPGDAPIADVPPSIEPSTRTSNELGHLNRRLSRLPSAFFSTFVVERNDSFVNRRPCTLKLYFIHFTIKIACKHVSTTMGLKLGEGIAESKLKGDFDFVVCPWNERIPKPRGLNLSVRIANFRSAPIIASIR